MIAPNNNIFDDAFKNNFTGPRHGNTLDNSSYEKENVNRSNTLEYRGRNKRVPPKTAEAKKRAVLGP